MKCSLSKKLIGILGIGLLLAFFGQIGTRYLFEIPTLITLESQSDAKDIEQVRLAISRLQRSLRLSVSDHAAWDQTYEFFQSDENKPLFQNYIDANLVDETLETLDVDGVVFVDVMGKVKYAFERDRIRDNDVLRDKFVPPNVDAQKRYQENGEVEHEYITGGIYESNIGPVSFGAGHILPSERPFPEPIGTVFFWRLLDQSFFVAISKDLQTEVRFSPVSETVGNTRKKAILDALQESGSWQLPRDAKEKLHWVLNDIQGKPVILIAQSANKRSFSQTVISHSVIVGFACSALILTILVLFFSRTVITRLLLARSLMLEIINTGDYSRRLPAGKSDELDSMFYQFNQLLGYIQKQNQELLEQNKTLVELSEQDALTGISNRRYLDEVLDRTWRQCARSGKMMSVLMIDVDYFKPYNDTYGHPAGDKVLVQIAETLQHNLHRATDYLARYGGEEFCVVLTDTNNSAAVSVAERLRVEIQNLRIRSDVSDCADVVTVSIGVATFIPDAKVHDINMVKAADEALYEAKALGRNCVYLKGGMSKDGLMNIKRN